MKEALRLSPKEELRRVSAILLGSLTLLAAGCGSSDNSENNPVGNTPAIEQPGGSGYPASEDAKETQSAPEEAAKDCTYHGIVCTYEEAMAQCESELAEMGGKPDEDGWIVTSTTVPYTDSYGEAAHASCQIDY